MNRLIFAIFALLTTFVCKAQNDQFSIIGKVDKGTIRKVFLLDQTKDQLSKEAILDSSDVVLREFKFSGHIASAVPAVVTTIDPRNPRNRVPVGVLIVEPGDITMMNATLSVGTPMNDTLAHIIDYANDKIATLTDKTSEEKQSLFQQYLKDLFSRHTNDPVGLRILGSYLNDDCEKYRLYEQAGSMIQTYYAKDKDKWVKSYATREGEMMTDFQNADGSQRLSDYVGKGKYTLVDFWASWCRPCKEEIPNIIKVCEKYSGEGLQVVGVDCWDKREAAEKTIEEMQIPYPQIFNVSIEQTSEYGISGIPHIILFGPEGRILRRNLRGKAIEEAVREALGK